jgi:outer membrane protein assembly factor BamA
MQELMSGRTFSRIRLFAYVLFLCTICPGTLGKSPDVSRLEDYEGRPIVSVDLELENSTADSATQAEFVSLLKVVAGTEFSTVRVRDSLQSLFDSGRVANARVEVTEQGQPKTGPIRLRFVVRDKFKSVMYGLS